ncbi:MAG: RagB/SusD family nutrient uptake outer membrane protein [Mangrovibacterium sp.]
MKNIFYIIIFVFIIICFNNCTDKLEITPDGRITLDDVWSDPDETEAYLNTCYSYQFAEGMCYYWWSYLDSFSDAYYDSGVTLGVRTSDWYNGAMTTTYDPLARSIDSWQPWCGYMFLQYWEAIRHVNTFLQNIENAAVDSESKRARMKAEAMVLRDFYYFELCRKYGPLPFLSKPVAFDIDVSTLNRPDTFQQVADSIAKDVDQVLNVEELPWRITTSSERARFTKAIAVTLKSRAQLYAASPLWNSSNDADCWEKALEYSKEAVELLTANGYELYYSQSLGEESFDKYFFLQTDLSKDPTDKETIMENASATSLYNGLVTFLNGFPSRDDDGEAGACPTQELVDAFDMQNTGLPIINPANRYNDEDHLQPNYVEGSGYDSENPYEGRDPRFYASVLYNGAYCPGPGVYVASYEGGPDAIRYDNRYTLTGYYQKKYIDESVPTNTASGGYWKKMRLAELYLNWAEAENEVNGPTQQVYDILKVIRDRVNMPNIKSGISDKAEMRAYIQKERLTEFCLEGQRFWDVRRWNILNQTDKLSTGMKITKNNDGTFNYNRFVIGYRHSYADKFLIFPIPESEVSILGSDWQNPGW